MAARQRAQERDFNRRRRLILDKGFELARNQLDTRLGKCLVYDNVKEKERLHDVKVQLERRNTFQINHQDARLRRFVFWRDRAIREPIVLCERQPQEESVEDMLEVTRPRYMRRRENQRTPSPSFSTMSLFRAHTKRNLNIWETPQTNQVRFRAALSPTPVLTTNEFVHLRASWRKQQQSRQRSLTPPSVANRQRRRPITDEYQNPRRPAATHVIPADRSDTTDSTSQSGSGDEAEDEIVAEELHEDPVFVTALPSHRLQRPRPLSASRSPEKPKSATRVTFAATPASSRPISGISSREPLILTSVCKDPASVAILQQVIRSRSR